MSFRGRLKEVLMNGKIRAVTDMTAVEGKKYVPLDTLLGLIKEIEKLL